MSQAMEVREDGEWVWVSRLTPAQEAGWIARQHAERDAFVSLAMRQSKLAVRYRRWAEEETNPIRAARYASDAVRYRREAKSSLHCARVRNV